MGVGGSHQKTIGCMCSCHRLCCSGHACRVLHQSFAPILRRRQAASGKRQAAHTRLQTACNMQHTYEKQEAGAACSMSSTIAARGSTARSMQPAALSAQHAARGKRHAASSTHAASGVQPAARHALNGIFATLSSDVKFVQQADCFFECEEACWTGVPGVASLCVL